MKMSKKHAFISYCHDDDKIVSELYDNLIAAGENLWWDKDILPGQDWKIEISNAIQESYAIIICFSREIESRYKSGIYPELRDAVSIFREYAPSSIFIIPVRLSHCKIPFITIDSTTQISDLQYIDFFPQSKRANSIQKIVQSLKMCQEHP